MGIGKRIKEARLQLGLNQKQLAELVGVSASAITNYENETSHPKEPVMYALLKVLNVDANYLFQDEMAKSVVNNDNNPYQTSNLNLKDKQVLDKYHQLNNEGQNKTLNYMDDLIKTGSYKPEKNRTLRYAARGGGIQEMQLTEEQLKALEETVKNHKKKDLSDLI